MVCVTGCDWKLNSKVDTWKKGQCVLNYTKRCCSFGCQKLRATFITRN